LDWSTNGELAVTTGDFNVQNELKGSRVLVDAGETGNYSGSRYLDMNNGTQMSANNGYCMPRAGSVVGVSISVQCSVLTQAGDVTIHVYKNGVSAFSATQSVNAVADWNWSATQARGTDTFAVDDVITLYVEVDVAFIGTLHDTGALAELQFDT